MMFEIFNIFHKAEFQYHHIYDYDLNTCKTKNKKTNAQIENLGFGEKSFYVHLEKSSFFYDRATLHIVRIGRMVGGLEDKVIMKRPRKRDTFCGRFVMFCCCSCCGSRLRSLSSAATWLGGVCSDCVCTQNDSTSLYCELFLWWPYTILHLNTVIENIICYWIPHWIGLQGCTETNTT